MPATFDRLGGFRGGVLLAEPPLPASSLTRNSRNTTELEPCLVGDWGRGRVAGCFVALALLFAVVTKGDACYL